MAASHVTSPLVERLRRAIQQDADLELRAIHKAELACYWARVGEFDLVDEIRTELRRDFGRGDSVRVSILIMCVESMLGYFRELSAESRDRMARAKFLSSLVRDGRLIALTSAWLAHIDFNQNRFDSMAAAARDCLDAIELADLAAMCRVSLVLGDAFLYCQQRGPSQAWYSRAHAAATESGDHAAIGALTYNRAALNVANARLTSIAQPLVEDDVKLLSGEVSSAISYQRMTELRSLEHLLSAAEVGVCLLQRKFAQAVEIAEHAMESGQVPMSSAEGLLLRADRAVGLASLGRLSEAEEVINELDANQLTEVAPDDLALVLNSILTASCLCGRTDKLSGYSAQIGLAMEAHSAAIAGLRELLTQFDPSLNQGQWRAAIARTKNCD